MVATLEQLRAWWLLTPGTFVNPGVQLDISLGSGIEKIITLVPSWRVINGVEDKLYLVSDPFAEVSFREFERKETMDDCKQFLHQISEKIYCKEDTRIHARPLRMEDIENNEGLFNNTYMRAWLSNMDENGNLFFAFCRGGDTTFSSTNGHNTIADLRSVLELPLTVKATVKDAKRDGKTPEKAMPLLWEE